MSPTDKKNPKLVDIEVLSDSGQPAQVYKPKTSKDDQIRKLSTIKSAAELICVAAQNDKETYKMKSSEELAAEVISLARELEKYVLE